MHVAMLTLKVFPSRCTNEWFELISVPNTSLPSLHTCVCVCVVLCGRQSWNVYFTEVTKGAPLGAAYQPPPTLSPTPPAEVLVLPPDKGDISKEISDHLLVNSLIRSYQVRECVK